MDKKDLQSKKLAELKVIAKEIGIKGADKLKKAELIEKLAANDKPEAKATEAPSVPAAEEVDGGEKAAKRKRTRKRVTVEPKEQPSLFEDKKQEKPTVEKPSTEKPELKENSKDSKPERTANKPQEQRSNRDQGNKDRQHNNNNKNNNNRNRNNRNRNNNQNNNNQNK